LRLATGYRRSPFFDAVVIEMVIITVTFNPIITISLQPEINNEIHLIFIKLRAKAKKAIRRVINNE
jgi:hypothetical protein